jgi:hypothetical protein
MNRSRDNYTTFYMLRCLSRVETTKSGCWVYITLIEWMSDGCLTSTQQFVSYMMAKTNNFQWYDDEVRFLPDQHAELDFHSASSLKHYSADRHVASLVYIILIPSQPICVLSP